MNSIKITCCLVVAGCSLMASALGLSCQKMRSINGKESGLGRSSSIFKDCWSRHFYEIRVMGVGVNDTNTTYTIRVLPVLKICKGGNSFPYYPGVVEATGITLNPRKSFSCVYVSPLTKWTKDTWTDVGGDWSKGVVNSTLFVELLKDGESTPLKTWSNASISALRNAKGIAEGKSKLKDIFVKWLNTEVNERVELNYLEEKPRIELKSWKEFNSK